MPVCLRGFAGRASAAGKHRSSSGTRCTSLSSRTGPVGGSWRSTSAPTSAITVELGKLGCRVVAWELLPLNFRVLVANVRMHNLGGSVELVPRGASEGPSRAVVARMYERSTGMTTIGGGALPTAWKMDEVKGERLQVAPASDELARLGLTRVDLVKISASPHSYAICLHLTPHLPRVRRRGARDGSFAGAWALAAPPRRALPAHRDLPAATRSQRSLRRRLPALPARAGPALLYALRQAAPSPRSAQPKHV
mmetsp:Transcript_13941/g.44813  ORF Transcript_13941/g.44813 Transcript_13941/m.44813 type:complete len:252 (-) Transcript_13941:96-851(-)